MEPKTSIIIIFVLLLAILVALVILFSKVKALSKKGGSPFLGFYIKKSGNQYKLMDGDTELWTITPKKK